MFDIATIASALACVREQCLPGKESVAVGEVLWCARRSRRLYSRSRFMSRPKNAVPHEPRDFCQLDIERNLIVGLRKEAIARGTNAPTLVRDLLDVIVQDHLVGAILDDAD